MAGLFITLEGGEGGGKSTQSRLLKEKLEKMGRDVVLTREPGGTPEAEKIRALIVNRDGGNWTPEAETLLIFAARVMHLEQLIKPALAAGKIVICDRFTDSTRAYQGYAGGMDLKYIENIKQDAIGDLEPDLTFILDLPTDMGLGRAGGRMAKNGSNEDRFEGKGAAFHEKLRQGFLTIAKKDSERCHVIDATASIEKVSNHIWEIVSRHSGESRNPSSNG